MTDTMTEGYPFPQLRKLSMASLCLDEDNMTDAERLLLEMQIEGAVEYAELLQHLPRGYYQKNPMPRNTTVGIVMRITHTWESRDGGTGGMFAESAKAAEQSETAVQNLLLLDREEPSL